MCALRSLGVSALPTRRVDDGSRAPDRDPAPTADAQRSCIEAFVDASMAMGHGGWSLNTQHERDARVNLKE